MLSKIFHKFQNFSTLTNTLPKYSVEHAVNGEVALELMQEQNYDLIMLDLMMPVMDGREFLHKLREDLKNTTPVMVYTGSQHEDLAKELLDAGANHVAYKPLGAKKLLGLVSELLPD